MENNFDVGGIQGDVKHELCDGGGEIVTNLALERGMLATPASP